MGRGTQFGIACAALLLLVSTAGCSSPEDEVRADLGRAQRADAHASLARSSPRELGDGTDRIDVAWTDRCTHATNSGLFRPATGTSCTVNGVAVYTLDSATTPADAVRAASTALNVSGVTTDDVAAGRIAPDGAVAGFDGRGAGTIGLGDSTQDDTFAVASTDDPSALTQPLEDTDADVIAERRGLGVVGRERALRSTDAAYVLVITYRNEYFRSLDNAEPSEPAPRPSVPPCFSGSNDCVGG